ncbi:MAG: thioredoxin family protein [Lentisphaeria bacterium]
MGIIDAFKKFMGSSEKEQVSELGGKRFIVLGACCKRSADSFANVKQAVLELGYSDEVINVGDFGIIGKYGVMQPPALVVNQKVVCSGKLIEVAEAKELIKKELGDL